MQLLRSTWKATIVVIWFEQKHALYIQCIIETSVAPDAAKHMMVMVIWYIGWQLCNNHCCWDDAETYRAYLCDEVLLNLLDFTDRVVGCYIRALQMPSIVVTLPYPSWESTSRLDCLAIAMSLKPLPVATPQATLVSTVRHPAPH